MAAMAFFSVTPLGKDESVSKYVSKVVKIAKDSGLSWQLTPMGTIIEGNTLEDVFSVINDGVNQLSDCNRISISIKIDYRKNRTEGMKQKIDSVMKNILD